MTIKLLYFLGLILLIILIYVKSIKNVFDIFMERDINSDFITNVILFIFPFNFIYWMIRRDWSWWKNTNNYKGLPKIMNQISQTFDFYIKYPLQDYIKKIINNLKKL